MVVLGYHAELGNLPPLLEEVRTNTSSVHLYPRVQVVGVANYTSLHAASTAWRYMYIYYMYFLYVAVILKFKDR